MFALQSGNKAITVLPQGEGPVPGNTSHWGDSVLKSTWTANAANYDFMQTLKAEGTRDFWTMQNGCNTMTSAVYTGCSTYGACTNPVIYLVTRDRG